MTTKTPIILSKTRYGAFLDPEAAQRVVRVVAARYKVTEEQIMGNSRLGPVAEARAVAMYFVEGSNSVVSRFFDRDWATVLHARRKVQGFCEVYPEFREIINELRKEVETDERWQEKRREEVRSLQVA